MKVILKHKKHLTMFHLINNNKAQNWGVGSEEVFHIRKGKNNVKNCTFKPVYSEELMYSSMCEHTYVYVCAGMYTYTSCHVSGLGFRVIFNPEGSIQFFCSYTAQEIKRALSYNSVVFVYFYLYVSFNIEAFRCM